MKKRENIFRDLEARCSRRRGLRLARWYFLIFALLVSVWSPDSAEAVYDLPGERVVQWRSNVGVTYREGIPARTAVCATIDRKKYGDGTADAAPAINNAILSCPNDHTVFIPAGTYRIDSTISIPKSKSITVRGAGPKQTILKSQNSNRDLNSAAIMIGDFPRSLGVFTSPNYCPQVNSPAGTVLRITGGTGKGSTTITLSDASEVNPGDIGIINVLDNNDSTLDLWTQGTNIGQEGSSSIYGFCCSTSETCRSLGQVVVVKEKNRNTITISPPLYTDYSRLIKPEFTRIPALGVARNIGIEDLAIDNAAGDGGVNSLIHILTSYNVWIKNIETSHARGRHVWIDYVNLFTEVRDSYFHDSINFVPNNYGVDIEQWGSGWLIENNVFNDTMIPIMLGAGASGGVAGYNFLGVVLYTKSMGWLIQGINQHAAGAWMNLAEGNYLTKISLDENHGANFYFTAFRNYVRYDAPPSDGHKKTHSVNLEIDRGSRLHNIVGNILGYPGFPWPYEWNGERCANSGSAIYKLGYKMGSDCSLSTWDSKTGSTLLRHGNYDYADNDIKWNGSDDRKLPASLYFSAKPPWWGDGAWPPIGPDLSPMISSIPARDRYLKSASRPAASSVQKSWKESVRSSLMP